MGAEDKLPVKVGFASLDGFSVDEHFGHAHVWQIYEFSDDAQFLETRKMPPVCGGGCNGSCDDNFGIAYDLLKDCKALFVSKIGEPAAAYMIQRGIKVFEAAGSIDKIAQAILSSSIL
ncbi:MAG: hypothetical protein K6E22_06760 [Treponema sp.]|nr:hypothetical protein [Treponema sp.]